MNLLRAFPDRNDIKEWHKKQHIQKIYKVNGHIHTPYSFSSFESIEQIFKMAIDENIKILGINDFNTTDGYDEFYENAINNKVFPLFNIEFIGLMKVWQRKKIRINDPNNPGRIYISGKGLNYPFSINPEYQKKIDEIFLGSQTHINAMIDKANILFYQAGIEIKLDYENIKNSFSKKLVRERHIAKAIRVEVLQKYNSEEKQKMVFTKIFGNNALKSKLTDLPSIENEIRSNLLKAGGNAYIKEDEKIFLDITTLLKIIISAGGIPCYPVLLDDASGNFTEFEANYESLYTKLNELNIACIELIPNRNDLKHLKNFVNFFNDKGFVILFGTEHNTPDMIPLTTVSRGNIPLDRDLETIAYEGACVIAAHQYLNAKGEEGFLNLNGKPKLLNKQEFVELGQAVIEWFLTMNKVK